METIRGLENLVTNTKKLEKLKQAFADELLKRVQARTPVASGLLRDSWEIEVKDGEINLKNDAKNEEGEEYVPYVEFGTYKMPGAFMVTSTVSEASEILKVAKKNAGL